MNLIFGLSSVHYLSSIYFRLYNLNQNFRTLEIHKHVITCIKFIHAFITGFLVRPLLLILLFLAKIANPIIHHYATRSNQRRQMDQIQANIDEMRNQMDARMTQFVEAITNVTRNQEELRALVERPHVENEQPELMFEDVSVGQPRPNVAMNFAGPNFNDQHANGYHV